VSLGIEPAEQTQSCGGGECADAANDPQDGSTSSKVGKESAAHAIHALGQDCQEEAEAGDDAPSDEQGLEVGGSDVGYVSA
jgi:hypothetical protein